MQQLVASDAVPAQHMPHVLYISRVHLQTAQPTGRCYLTTAGDGCLRPAGWDLLRGVGHECMDTGVLNLDAPPKAAPWDADGGTVASVPDACGEVEDNGVDKPADAAGPVARLVSRVHLCLQVMYVILRQLHL